MSLGPSDQKIGFEADIADFEKSDIEVENLTFDQEVLETCNWAHLKALKKLSKRSTLFATLTCF